MSNAHLILSASFTKTLYLLLRSCTALIVIHFDKNVVSFLFIFHLFDEVTQN